VHDVNKYAYSANNVSMHTYNSNWSTSPHDQKNYWQYPL